MPSLVITGHPSVGKTTFSSLLSSRALSHPSISKVVHITESSACRLPKNECYANSHTEKETRASLKSAFDSAVTNSKGGNSSTLVILDSLNFIKGYRYELYCISKAAGKRHGVVWVQGSKADEERRSGTSGSDLLAKARNQERLHANKESGDYYQEQIMDELVARYEPPDERNRWENPLYKVDVSALVPWNINGTLNQINLDTSSEVTLQMQEVKLDIAPTKVVTKSASGFKRNKKVKPKTTETLIMPQSSVHHLQPLRKQ
jgi:protein KTI12